MALTVKTRAQEVEGYLTDTSALSGGHCQGVCLPETVEQLRDFLKRCHNNKEFVTVCGARTGTVGGSVPFGGWLVSLERLNHLGEVERVGDLDHATLTVGAGVVLKDLQQKVQAAGYFYPPNPTEISSFVGGNIATNASGTRSFKYGSTRNFVEALSVVLMDGREIHLKRGEVKLADVFELPVSNATSQAVIHGTLPSYTVPENLKYAMGYWVQHPMDAVDLFVGSEGTLGVVTEATLRVIPAPKNVLGGVFFFSSFEAAYRLVEQFQGLRRSQNMTFPCSVEYYDVHSLQMIREYLGQVPEAAQAALYLEQEVWEDEHAVLEQWERMFTVPGTLGSGCIVASDVGRQRELIEFRHALPEKLSDYFRQHQIQKISTDFAVPQDKFMAFQKFYTGLLETAQAPYVAFGHLGDCNIHINMLPKTPEEEETCRRVYEQIMKEVVKVGGVIAAEHGIGKIKRKWMALQFTSKQLQEMQALKAAFDPAGLLNPGTLLP